MSSAEEEAGSEARSYVRFRCQEELYALPLLDVREVVVSLPLSTIPRGPACASGMMNHHGRVFVVVDLAALQGMGRATPREFVVLLDHPERRLGLAVDVVDGVGPLSPDGELARLGDAAVTMLERDNIIEQVDRAFSEVFRAPHPDGVVAHHGSSV